MKKTKKSGSKKPLKKTVKKASLAAKKMAAPKSSIGISPTGDRVVVRPLSPEEAGLRSASGIIIPETVDKEKSEQGIIMAVGPGKMNETGERIPVSVSVGDRVLFSKYGYDEVKVGGNEYYLVGEPSILAILEK